MGQGYSLTSLSAGSASIDIPEFADLVYEKSLGAARFMKSIRARNQQGLVLVNGFVKPYPSFSLRKYLDIIIRERDALTDIPNALAYQRVLETANGGFLARQYIHSSVYDRMSTRPFLEDIEKKWLAFQLLCAVRDCHAREVFHGDIKTENLLVTSWNWLYLTDFSSSYKPTYLPEDNPADFSFYFDISGRRTCYLAPERFVSTGQSQTESGVNWAMDIFSAGCVIAEIFLEGPIFTLSQLFRFRKGDLSLEHTHLTKLKDGDVRELILHMVQLDPESRYTAEEILTFWRGKVFPEYFYGFLHQYMAVLTDSSSGRKVVSLEGNARDSDERIERVYTDFDKISYFLDYVKQKDSKDTRFPRTLANRAMPVHVDVNQTLHIDTDALVGADKGTLIFLAVVVSSLRSTSKAAARCKACDLFLAFGQQLPDEIKLDRIVPYVAVLLSDDSDMVKIAALRTMTQILATVQVVSPVNAYIFPEYIFPRLKAFMLTADHTPSPIIRATYASCLASLSQSSARILDMMQAIKADGRLPSIAANDWASEATFHGLFDVARGDLVSHFEDATKELITDRESSVRRALLGSVSSLCVFFGSTKAGDVILSHLNTYLNDQDWLLKCSFIKVLVGVATFVGVANLEKFILPLMIQSLTDPETFVVERVIRSLASMVEVGLLQKAIMWEMLSILVRFLVHPSLWVREASAHFIAACGKQVSASDRYCIMLPMIQPFLRTPILEVSQYQILDSIKKPIPKVVLDMAMLWATKSEKGLFWKSAARDAVFVSPEPDSGSHGIPSRRQFAAHISSAQRNEEDEQWLAKLRGLGVQNDDELKLLALREYIWRVAHRKVDVADGTLQGKLNSVVSLNQINVTPRNIFFDNNEPMRAVKDPDRHVRTAEEPNAIAEALIEASNNIKDLASRTKSSTAESAQQVALQQTKPKPIVTPSGRNNAPSAPTPYSPSAAPTPSSTPPSRREHNRAQSSHTWPREEALTEEISGNPRRQRLMVRKGSDNSLRHRSSAINLLNRKETAKAGAATSTSAENAFAKLDGPMQPRRLLEPPILSGGASKSLPTAPTDLAYEPNHSYAGNDRNILRLLDNHFLENFPTDLRDLGQVRLPIDPRSPIPRITDASHQAAHSGSTLENTVSHPEPWHPSGHLLTLFTEHTAAVNCVAPAPDHAFFATASDDGTCRIWDTTRLEKNVTPRSRQTYKYPGGAKVKALCFVEETHAFAAAGNDGTIQIVKVDYKKMDGGESTRYGKLGVMREYQIAQGVRHAQDRAPDNKDAAREHAIGVRHYRTSSSQSVLLLLTSRSHVLAVDLKTMDTLYSLTNPLAHGSLTTFVLDKKHCWLLVGTSHGILDLWDLRFRLRIRSWGLKSGARIQKLCLHPSKGKGRWVVVAAGPEISVWDIEKLVCKEVYRPDSSATATAQASNTAPEAAPSTRAAAIASTKPYEPWLPDDEPPEKLFSRFTGQVTENGNLIDPGQTVSASSSDAQRRNPYSSPLPALTALCVGYDNLYKTSSPQDPTKAPFFISGGSDCKLRFWDLSRPEDSSVVSGLQPSANDGTVATPRPRYEVSHLGGQISLVLESLPSSSQGTLAKATASSPRKGGSRASNASDGGSGQGTGIKLPRSTIISKQQQMLLQNHLDGITDCCVLARPYGVVVSVDRSGGVYVFQ